MEQTPRNAEAVGYMMLFCALMMVRNESASVEEIVKMVPLAGNASFLARELAAAAAA